MCGFYIHSPFHRQGNLGGPEDELMYKVLAEQRSLLSSKLQHVKGRHGGSHL